MKRVVKKVPSSVTLPGGYQIEVNLLPKKKADQEMSEGSYAEWDVGERAINLRACRRGQDRVEDFVHEMGHAMVDWSDWFQGKTETED